MVFPFTTITQSAKATQTFGQEIGAAHLNQKGENVPNVVCLWGELGSGKTTLVQGIARGLGITKRVLSPTFIIVRRYEIPTTDRHVYHWDLYRLRSMREAEDLGFFEIVRDTRDFLIVEWPERLGDALPYPRIDIRCLVLPNGDHRFMGEIIINS